MNSAAVFEHIKRCNTNPHPKPMDPAEIDKMYLPKFRDGTGVMPLPHSMKLILAYDQNFSIDPNKKPLLSPILDQFNTTEKIETETIDHLIRTNNLFGPGLANVPKELLLWNDEEMPAIIEISHCGEHRVFYYVTELDDAGEYPIARFDDQPSVWISEANLWHYILRCVAEDSPIYPQLIETLDLDKQLSQRKNRDLQYEKNEGLSQDPKISEYLEMGE